MFQSFIRHGFSEFLPLSVKMPPSCSRKCHFTPYPVIYR
jgi:hypothetical protein